MRCSNPVRLRYPNRCQVVPIAARLVVHLLLRTIPTALICVGLYVVLLGEFLVIDDAELALSCGGEVCCTIEYLGDG